MPQDESRGADRGAAACSPAAHVPDVPRSGPELITHSAAIEANTKTLRARTPAAMMAVVKADGYGLGMHCVAAASIRAGARWLGTTRISDAVSLRSNGFRVPILSWLNSDGVDTDQIARHRVDVAVGSLDELSEVIRMAHSRIRVHLHVDTGMARGGASRDQWSKLMSVAAAAARAGRIDVVGIMGLLPHAESTNLRNNDAGIHAMNLAVALARGCGLRPRVLHLAATAATLHDPRTHMTLVRTGAGLVGIDPTGQFPLRGAATFTAPVTHSTVVAAGTPVGYDGTFVTAHRTSLSVLPVGYADGIPRAITPDAEVAVNGRRHRIIGRVSMDQILLDTNGIHHPPGTTAVIFSPDPARGPLLHDWARWASTIPHTILAGIGQRVTRRSE